ncbi:MAG: type II toxin-antitoxin system VapC family toxin [Candidatus Bathyarchaeia archaeon]
MSKRLKKGLLYIDSNVFLYPIVYDAKVVGEAQKSKGFLLKVAEGAVEVCTSTITWDEIAWVIRKIFGFNLSAEQSRKFLSFPNLKLVGVKKSTVLRAQEIMEKYQVKPRDAIHAATALENNVVEIVSYDKDFEKVEGLKRIEP